MSECTFSQVLALTKKVPICCDKKYLNLVFSNKKESERSNHLNIYVIPVLKGRVALLPFLCPRWILVKFICKVA